MSTAYTIRRFTPADVHIYRAIRLEALQVEPGMFGNSYDMEAAMPASAWQERLTDRSAARFGLYHGNELIGTTSVIVANRDTPFEAYMTQSYIKQPYRGMGLSQMLYDARIQWAREHGITQLIIGHRRINEASFRANQRNGFVYTHSEQKKWPDGTTDDMLYYKLML